MISFYYSRNVKHSFYFVSAIWNWKTSVKCWHWLCVFIIDTDYIHCDTCLCLNMNIFSKDFIFINWESICLTPVIKHIKTYREFNQFHISCFKFIYALMCLILYGEGKYKNNIEWNIVLRLFSITALAHMASSISRCV